MMGKKAQPMENRMRTSATEVSCEMREIVSESRDGMGTTGGTTKRDMSGIHITA